MTNQDYTAPYRPLKNYSLIAVILLGILGITRIFFIIFSLVALLYPTTTLDFGNKRYLVGLFLVSTMATLRMPVFIATVVFFLIWENRAYKNLPALKANPVEFTPGWAVGWWFIPFANLIKPFQAMRELWSESEPVYNPEFNIVSVQSAAPTIMIFWWIFWLISNIFTNITSITTDPQEFSVLMIVSSSLEIVATVLIIKIILQIGKRQQERLTQIGTAQNFAPPPPSDFNFN